MLRPPTEDDCLFWGILENDLHLEIPNYIKNAFTACAFSNAITFRSIDQDDIVYVENYVKSEFGLCLDFTSKVKLNDSSATKIAEVNKIHFFGRFASNPEQFRFSAVDKKIIALLVTYVIETVDIGGVNNQLNHFCKKQSTAGLFENTTRIYAFFGDLMNTPTEPNSQSKYTTRTHFFLNKLMATADRNAVREKNGYRYDDDLKQFATYFRMLSGPFAFDTLQRNLELAVPTLSSTDRYIRQMKCNIAEGVLRCEELRLYLEERNFPLEVSLSEDATRIDGRIQYDSRTNQLVGFVLPIDIQTGMPIPYSYKARNDREILQHFVYGETAHFVNVVMAHPFGKAAPFCLLVFGTNSKYTAEDVSKRWMHITNQLRKSNIGVKTLSSDSDPKYNSAMRQISCLGLPLTSPLNFGSIDWFSCANLEPPFNVQDTPHIGTKLRNFILKTRWNPKMLPFGKKYFIDVEHLQFLRRNFSKSEHMLCASTLNPVDKQNFKSVETMCAERVTDLLRRNVKNSEGTAKFLEMMRDVIAAYWSPELTPLERIEKIWFSLFIIRIWRQYVLSTKGLTLKNNFLSQYSYVCIELNAHSLVLIIVLLQEKNLSQLFMPKLFSSQPCESFFRMIRSFTSTFSTVANCSVKEILDRMNKLQLQSDIPIHNGKHFFYPRTNNSSESVCTKNELPARREIIDLIEKCKKKAVQYANKIGLDMNDLSVTCQVPPYITKTSKRRNRLHSHTNININSGYLYGKLKVAMLLKNGSYTNYAEKILDASVEPISSLVEMDFPKMNISKRIIVKKTFLCWLLRKSNPKLSSDRLLRVKSKIKTHTVYVRNIKRSTKPKRKK